MSKGRRIWVLGATSAIAHAYARRRAERGGTNLLLIGRNDAHLRANAADLVARGATASVKVCDLAHPTDHDILLTEFATAEGLPDEVLIAYGALEQTGHAAGEVAYARELIEINFTSAACWLLAIIARWDRSRPLTLVVLGSVAGDRGRARNFLYGSAKGGLDLFLEGLQQAYAGTTLRIVRVKPGFVDTPMTADVVKDSLLWATPDRVAADIERAADRGRSVVYTPWFWQPIMMIIRHLPRFIFQRLKI